MDRAKIIVLITFILLFLKEVAFPFVEMLLRFLEQMP